MGTLRNRVQKHLPPHAVTSLWVCDDMCCYYALLSCYRVCVISWFVMLIFAMTCVLLLYSEFGRLGADLLRRNQMKPDITRYTQVEPARWFHFLIIEVWCQCLHSPHNIMNTINIMDIMNIMNNMHDMMLISWMIWCSLWNPKRAQTNSTRFVTPFASSVITSFSQCQSLVVVYKFYKLITAFSMIW